MRAAAPGTTLLAGLLLLGAAGCAGSSLHVDSVPGGAAVYVDGERRGESPLVVPLPYHGTARVEVELEGHEPVRRHLSLPPPASPWLFPLDLPLELARRLFQEPGAHLAVRLSPEGPVGPEEEDPALLEALGRRARLMARSR